MHDISNTEDNMYCYRTDVLKVLFLAISIKFHFFHLHTNIFWLSCGNLSRDTVYDLSERYPVKRYLLHDRVVQLYQPRMPPPHITARLNHLNLQQKSKYTLFPAPDYERNAIKIATMVTIHILRVSHIPRYF